MVSTPTRAAGRTVTEPIRANTMAREARIPKELIMPILAKAKTINPDIVVPAAASRDGPVVCKDLVMESVMEYPAFLS